MATREPQRSAAVGRVALVDFAHGYVTADFPEGRRLVSVDMRELGHYIPGDEIRVDQAGRPLPPRGSR
jgi:hypothetical protein